MIGILAGLRPISTSLFNLNYSSQILRERLAGLLLPRSISYNITNAIYSEIKREIVARMSTNSAITLGRVAGLNRPISTSFINQRHFKTFFFVNFIIIVTKLGEMVAGIMRLISYTSTTTHSEKHLI